MLCERPAACLEDGLGLGVSAELVVDGLAIALLELGLVVEKIDLRRPAEHEQEDAGLGPDAPVWRALGEGIPGFRPGRNGVAEGETVGFEHPAEGETRESCAGLPQELTPGAGTLRMGAISRHGAVR
jgi:hypothetical protein